MQTCGDFHPDELDLLVLVRLSWLRFVLRGCCLRAGCILPWKSHSCWVRITTNRFRLESLAFMWFGNNLCWNYFTWHVAEDNTVSAVLILLLNTTRLFSWLYPEQTKFQWES